MTAHATHHTREPVPHDAGAACYSEYTAVLTQQLGLLEELDVLSRRQGDLVGGEQLDPLLALLEDRQRIVDRITQTARTAERLGEHWLRCRDSLPTDRRDDVQRRIDAISSLAAAIARRDDADHQRLRQRLDLVTSELAELSHARRANAAYGQEQATGPRLQDRHA